MSETIQNESEGTMKIEDPKERVETVEEAKVDTQVQKEQTHEVIGLSTEHKQVVHVEATNAIQGEEKKIEAIELNEEKNIHEQTHQNNQEVVLAKDMENVQQSAAEEKQVIEPPSLPAAVEPEIKEPVNHEHIDIEQKQTQQHVQALEKQEHPNEVEEVANKEKHKQNEMQPQQQIIIQKDTSHVLTVIDVQAVEESRTQQIESKVQAEKEVEIQYPEIQEKLHLKEDEGVPVQQQKENSKLIAQQNQVENVVHEQEEKVQSVHEREQQIILQEHTLQKSEAQQDKPIHVDVQEEKIDEHKEKTTQHQIELVPQPQKKTLQPEKTNSLEEPVERNETSQQPIPKIESIQVKNEEQVNSQTIQVSKVEQTKQQQSNPDSLNKEVTQKESFQEQQIIHPVPSQIIDQKANEAKQVQNEPKQVSQLQIVEKEALVQLKPQDILNEQKQQMQIVHVQQEKVEQIHHDEHYPTETPATITQIEKIEVYQQEMQQKYENKEETQPYQVKINVQENIYEKVENEKSHKEIVEVQEPATIQEKAFQEQQQIEHHEKNIQQIPVEIEQQKPIETANVVEEHANKSEEMIQQTKQQYQRQASEAKQEITVQHKVEDPLIVPSNETLNKYIHQNTEEAFRKQSEHFNEEASQKKQATISEAKAQEEFQMAVSNKETANFMAEEQSERHHNNQEIVETEEPIVQKQEIIADIAVEKQEKINRIERINEQEKPISEPSRQPQNPSIHSNKEAQFQEKQENIFQFTPLQQEETQKKGYRFNTQLIDNHQQKAKQQNFVEFVEFTPEEKIEIRSSIKQTAPIAKNENMQINTEENIDKELNYTFLPPIQTKKQTQQQQKTIDILKGQLSNKKVQSAKQGVGKISRKNLFEKKVHDVIADLKKYDDQKPAVKVQNERKFSSRKRKTDSASKHDNIGLKSNIINVTIGELLSKDQSQQAEKLLGQIDDLKKKLHELQRKKELNMFTLESSQKNIENESAQKDTIMSNKSAKKNTGRIYRRAESNNSRVTEEIQTQGYMTEKSSVGFMNPSISSAPRQRLSSTQDFPFSKTASKEPEIENKTGPIIFRVKKNSKTTHGPFDFNLGEKEAGYIKSKEFQGEDKNFQTRREERQDSSQERLTPIQKPVPRKLHFQEDFKQEVERYFIELGKDLPKRDWNQQQLTETAKETFKKFGVSIVNEKKLVLCVKKYKNCVSFILDSARTILWYYEGKFYFGGWKINNSGQGQKNGWGYDYSPGKYVYSGNFIENKRDGYGIMKFLTRDNDVIYEGEWKNGFKHGVGKQRDIDGSEYIGSWVQGKKSLYGRIKVSNQQGYAGNFLNGVKNGEGSEKFKNGDSYEGSYYDGKFHGMGVYTWANLSRYEGQFKQGSRNGNGIWISNYQDQNSDRYEGQYRNDRKNGFGVYKWKDGTVYQGEFLNDLKHGQGIVSYGDGKSTKLQWFEGNVVPRQNAERQRSGIKRPISKSNSKKGQERQAQRNPPLIKFNGNQIKLKPTRISLGMQQI